MPYLMDLVSKWERDGQLPKGSKEQVLSIFQTLANDIREDKDITVRLPYIGRINLKTYFKKKKDGEKLLEQSS